MTPDKDAYTVAEAAKRLGISPRLAYEMVAGGRIPSIRVGKNGIRIPVKAFEDWIESETSQTARR
jgi:excisionase family DNA binding protein